MPATPDLTTAFTAAVERLEPFGRRPALAVAVSGGADSLALAILTRQWACRRDASVLGLVVDHGLRPESADEARLTLERLAGLGIPARLLTIPNLQPGPALAERARIARHQILTKACREAGILHLLLGHHLADQRETLTMRVLRCSGNHGLAAMSALRETSCLRVVRPLLGTEPAMLRDLLRARDCDWVEDPSNRDQRAMRPRLRARLGVHGRGTTELNRAVWRAGLGRTDEEAEAANELAHRVSIRPEGYALLSPGRIGRAALSNLIRTIGGARYHPSMDRIGELAIGPRPATIAGVRLMRAGRFGSGLLIVREEAAVAKPVRVDPDWLWDGRFRVVGWKNPPADVMVGKLGDETGQVRHLSRLPSAILRTLPALRAGKVLVAVPHLGYWAGVQDDRIKVLFEPPEPAAGACFVPAYPSRRG